MIYHVGLTVCALAATAAGFLAGERKKKEARDLSFILSLVDHLRREIAYMKTDLSRCFLGFGQKDREECLTLFSDGRYSEGVKKLKIGKKTRAELLAFFEELGKSGSEEELRKIGRYYDALEKQNADEQAKLAGGVKSARVLGICTGAAILLLFW